MNERLSSAKLYDVVTAIVGEVVDKKKYVQEVIIPRMDKHRGRFQPQTREEIVRKLFSASLSKPGEAAEIIEERVRAIIEETVRAKWKLTPELALEIADVIYCTLQPNCPDFVSNPKPFISALGVDTETALAVCIVKYETRLRHGSPANYRKIEEKIMARFLESLAVSETRS